MELLCLPYETKNLVSNPVSHNEQNGDNLQVAHGVALGVTCQQLVHLACILHSEAHAIVSCELELGVHEFIRTVVDDEDFRLFEVSSGRKWGVAGSLCLDVVLNGVPTWIVEFRGGNDAHWVL